MRDIRPIRDQMTKFPMIVDAKLPSLSESDSMQRQRALPLEK